MYGKRHNEEAKKKISDKISKHMRSKYVVGIYDLKDNLIKKFKNNVKLSVFRTRTFKYIQSYSR